MFSTRHFLKKTLSPLQPFLPGRGRGYLSVDIGSSSVKLIEVRDTRGSLRLTNVAIAPLPNGVVRDNVVHDAEYVANTLRTLTASQGFHASEVITAVPGPTAIIKRATFPLQSANELHETILFEAANYIPENLDEVSLDYHVLDFIEDANAVEVVLVAVRHEVVNGYLSAIRAAGFLPVIVDVDYFALENMVEANYEIAPDEIAVLLHIGAECSLISVLQKGCTAFAGDVPLGGTLFTDTLARELDLGREEAEALKIGGTVEISQQKNAEHALAPTLARFLDETEHLLSLFWSGEMPEQPPTVYLSGGSARLPGLARLVGERLHAPVILSDPFRTVAMARQVDQQFAREHASALAVGMGLATRRPGDK